MTNSPMTISWGCWFALRMTKIAKISVPFDDILMKQA